MNNFFPPNVLPYSYVEINPQPYNHHPYNMYGNAQVNNNGGELNQLKKSLGFLNLVQTRKKDRY